MEKFSFNLREHFQDNSVDFSESNLGANTGITGGLITAGNPDFNHKAPTLWNYLGVHNMSQDQIDCTFECVQKGLDCSSDCGNFNRKCNYKCAGKSVKCIKTCMDIPRKEEEEAEEEANSIQEEEELEEEDKSTRLNKNNFEPRYYDNTSDLYAEFIPSNNNSFTIETDTGIYTNLINRVLDDQERADELLQHSSEMRVKFT